MRAEVDLLGDVGEGAFIAVEKPPVASGAGVFFVGHLLWRRGLAAALTTGPELEDLEASLELQAASSVSATRERERSQFEAKGVREMRDA